MDLKEFEQWKRRIEGLQRQADRMGGALDEVTKLLQKEFGCSTPEEAGKLLLRLVKEHNKLAAELEQEMNDFKRKWGDKLEG